VHLWRGKVHRHYGIVRSQRTMFERAVSAYGSAVATDPGLSEGYLERGILLWRELDKPAQALQDFDRVLALRPGLAEVLFFRGMAYQAVGEYRAAIGDLLSYVASDDQAWREHALLQLGLLREMEHSAGQGDPAGG
jgi:tetratricopeptide (TPR) repeat protein